MNVKAASLPTLILIGCLMALPAHAFWASIPIDRTNIDREGSFLRIKTTSGGPTNEQRIFFTIVVLPISNHSPELCSGNLSVRDLSGGATNRWIITTQVQPQNGFNEGVPKELRAKCRRFEFSIDAAFVDAAEFSVNETIDSKLGTAGTAYNIKLRDFVDTK